MKLKPVETPDTPAYPTRSELLSDAGGLPRSWRRGKGLAGAAGALLAVSQIAGCGGPSAELPTPRPEPIVQDAAEWTRSIMAPAPPAAAPAPPSRAVMLGYFMLPLERPSEDETMQILDEAGVDIPTLDEGDPP
jgi:hypothetical protein